MINKLELKEIDGTLVTRIPCLGASIEADRSRPICRSARFTIPSNYLPAIRILGRQMVAWDGDQMVFVGPVVGPTARSGDGTVTVACQDKAKRYADSKFVSDTTYEDLTATDTVRAFTPSASSEMAIDTDMRAYASVYYRSFERVSRETGVEYRLEMPGQFSVPLTSDLGQVMYGQPGTVVVGYAVDLGESAAAVPLGELVESGSPTAGNYSISCTGETPVQYYRLTMRFDLRASVNVKQFTATTNGAATARISADGSSWSAYTPGATGRYLELVITRNSTPITLGVAIIAGQSFPASNIAVNDDSSWRPSLTDLNRQATLTLAVSANANDLFLRWGTSSSDRTTWYEYKIEGTTNGSTWTTLVENAGATPSILAEHPFARATYQALRVTVLKASGPVALRYAEVHDIVATNDIASVIKSILSDESEFDFATTELPVKAVTFERGTDKWTAAQKLAESGGFELFFRRSGVPCLRVRDCNTTDPTIKAHSAMLTFDVTWNDDVANEIVGVFETTGVTLTSVAVDDNASSLTSVQRLGHRTQVVQFPLCDTQAKLDAATRTQLQIATKRTVDASFGVSGDPTMEVGEVRYLIDAATGATGFYVIESLTLSDDPATSEYDSTARVREVA